MIDLAGHGAELGGIGFLLSVAGDVINALRLVQLRLYIVVVRGVFQQKLHVVKVAVVVAELLGQVKAVGVHMAIIGQRVVILRVGALPGQGDVIGIARIAVNYGGIAVHGTSVSNAHGQVAVAPEQAGSGIINGSGGVDLRKTICCHGNGHAAAGFRAVVRVVGSKLPVLLHPNRHPICAGSILEELNLHVILVILDALGEFVHKGVSGQRSGGAGDGGQRGDHLILHHIAVRGRGSVMIAIGDIIDLSGILPGVCFGFTDSFLQRGIAGFVLGVERQIIIPLAAVHGGHGQ